VDFLTGISSNKYIMLLVLVVVLLAIGTFMDLAPLIIICTPIFCRSPKRSCRSDSLWRHLDPQSGIGLITPPSDRCFCRHCDRQDKRARRAENDLAVLFGGRNRLVAGRLYTGAVAVASGAVKVNALMNKKPAIKKKRAASDQTVLAADRKHTINDIARMANVSKKTVSRVIMNLLSCMPTRGRASRKS